MIGESTCPECGRQTRARDLCCGLCGHMLGLKRPRASVLPDVDAHLPTRKRAAPGAPWSETYTEPEERPLGLAPEVFYPGLGALLALVFLLPMPGWIGWYFAALVHEMGHAATAWGLGCPAIPALGVGEAMTIETDLILPLALALWGAAVYLASRMPVSWLRWVSLTAAAFAYPVLAFSSFGTLPKLVAGHAAELAFAGLALWRAMTGGFTSSRAERTLYGMLGWFLIADNLHLSAGLITSSAARAVYATNGSFGCTNDYIRVANGWFGGSLEGVAFLASLSALAVLPTVLLLRSLARRQTELG
ncbi:MAG: hypothetical protein ACI8QZ_002953 [Chlamydiales bacterium]|jgi:hypothetical protein